MKKLSLNSMARNLYSRPYDSLSAELKKKVRGTRDILEGKMIGATPQVINVKGRKERRREASCHKSK